MKNEVYETGSSAVKDRRPPNESDSEKPDPEEMMKKMEAAGKPGPAHKALDAFAGNWKAEVKCWHEPGGEANVSHGTAKVNWILNGCFLNEEFHGEMMGKPFTGRGLFGYDNVKQTFNYVWLSDNQTSMFISEGKGSEGNKVITLEGKSSCPVSGRTDIPMKMVLRVLGANKHTFEMFDGSKGESAKVMEITYTRN